MTDNLDAHSSERCITPPIVAVISAQPGWGIRYNGTFMALAALVVHEDGRAAAITSTCSAALDTYTGTQVELEFSQPQYEVTTHQGEMHL